MGGEDRISSYYYYGSGAGMFTFSNEPLPQGGTLPGTLNTDDEGVGVLGASIFLDLQLSSVQNDGVTPFDPESTASDGNVKKARFTGGASVADLVIFTPSVSDPNVPMEVLLSFDIAYIDVTNATKSTVADGDGSISLGDASETATSSLLTVSGGTLASLVGGVGTEARLSVLLSSLTPGILTKSDFNGYLGQDFTAGIGTVPETASVWDLTIIPIPEPGAASLLAFALLNLAAIRRWRRG